MRTTRSFTESVADPDHWRDIQYDPLRIRLLSSVDNHRHRNQLRLRILTGLDSVRPLVSGSRMIRRMTAVSTRQHKSSRLS